MRKILPIAFLKLTLLFVLFGTCVQLKAQIIQPVTGSFVVQPPYSTYLSNYFIPGNERMYFTATFNDFNEPSIDAKLRVQIEGNGFSLQTKRNFSAPFTLVPGANSVDASVLERYFNFNNLNANGIDIQTLLRNGALPEGFYTFKVEVLDLQSGRKISNTAVATARLIKNKPPLMTLPANESAVPVINPQNILFQWQAVSDPTINTAYELTLVKVPKEISPNDAINSTATPLLDAVEVRSTNYNYGATEMQLIVGNTYAWRVKAYDINGLSIFENNGLSEVHTFTYGFPPNGVIPLSLPADSASIPKKTPYFQWMGPSNAIAGTPINYNLSVVEVNANQSPQQAMLNNTAVISNSSPLLYTFTGYTYSAINNLKSGQKYAWEVNAEVNDVEVATSAIQTFSTLPDVQNIFIGNHLVVVNSLSNPNPKSLSGKGTLIIDAKGTKTKIKFQNLKI